ncbi:T-lymphocyte surface antigen Ly-9-like [Garra rufa]|uniref:T-lymphocyte surface antigen Ly-9-like n=1 Tax=Garra rufa TaxID=137080 RepID=UPI003CCE9DB5
MRKKNKQSVFGDGLKSVMEGGSVTLNTGLTEMMDDHLILWRFGTENTLIAQIDVMADSVTVYDNVLDGRFRDRLTLDHQTGSLTITNITTQQAGLYKLQSNSVSKNFSLMVYASLPTPNITRDCLSSSSTTTSSLSSSQQNCSLVCSVVNVSDVTLSWYKGNSLLSSISVSDLSISLSLPLEVEYHDKNTYRCVLNNPFRNQTQHLDISKLCHTCSGVFGDGLKSVSVTEGDSVTLNTGLTEIMYEDMILWRYGAENTLIAEINVMASSISINDDVLDGRFRDRLKLDYQTGSLTITNITTEHAGLYKLQNNRVIKDFSLTVHARLPLPYIFFRDCFSSSSFSSSYCSLLCSVVNVGHVTLSWYKGNSLLSSISVSDLSISLSLPLEVEYQDKNTYSCVINNTISNQTRHLDISELCHKCSEVHIHRCDTVEAWIRLVVTALMGVAAAAAVFLLVNDVRSTRG